MTAGVGLLITDDLIFSSKVTATARAHGLTVTVARSVAQAAELARRSPPAGVLVDLHNPGLELPGFLAELKAVCPAMPRVIGYGSHVDVETLKAARAAGLDRVMPRSQFVTELEASLPAWLA
jgi:DNA-binding NarL/FixJ family response regulator